MAHEYNIVVIGAGAGGLVSSLIGSAIKAKVALIEKDEMGGDCLNTGCVPSKALIKTAKIVQQIRNSEKYGIKNASYELDFEQVMNRVHKIIGKIAPNDSVERFTGLGVECFKGEAEILDKHTVRVGDKVLTTKNIILAHGAEPAIPPIKGLDQIQYLTSENLWKLKELPKKLVILGGGPIGTEMSQTFQRLGSQVTQIEMEERILNREDSDIAEVVIRKLKNEGLNILSSTKAVEVKVSGDANTLICETVDGKTTEVKFDYLLIAVGRKARSIKGDLQKLGIKLRPNGTVDVDKYMRANGNNIFACGDITGPYQFTHMAAHQAYYCTVNALLRPLKFSVDYSAVPWVTYSDPEVAQVGLNETEAKKRNIPYEIHKYDVGELDRAITESEDHGCVKILLKPGTDKILGVNIVAASAGEMLAEFTSAMKNKLGLSSILGTIHPYPTMSDGNKLAAGVWKKSTVSKAALTIAKFIMSLRR
jgi:dihydrolipoamide dehydrogenase